MQVSNAVVVERSSPVSLATVHYTQPTAVAVAAGVVTQAQPTSSTQLLTHTSSPLAQAVVLPYPLPQGAPHAAGQLQAGAYIPAAYNYVSNTCFGVVFLPLPRKMLHFMHHWAAVGPRT